MGGKRLLRSWILIRTSLALPINYSLSYERVCKTRENSNFLKKDKIVILVKIRNFYRSRMTKRISLLESFRKI